MTCPRCHQENPSSARFCMSCGVALAGRCGKCHTDLPGEARFCFSCGEPVSALPASTRFASPEAYTPKHLAERILTSKTALEGERKQVTVLFADLKGSMELLAGQDPEEAREILDPVLERMIEAVHRYEGTVNQVMGDGIMALFGAPVAHEDHAVRACYAALGMQESIKRYGEGVRRAEGIPIRIRVGLNSGEVVVRAIGSDLRMDYTAVGQTTHLAARMEQLASPGAVFLTAETLALVEGFVRVTSLGETPVKGLPDPVDVFELIGLGATRRRFEAAAARGLTRFVGRHAELDVLHQALERARAGHGQVVGSVGEPGVGKSRLCWEFTQAQREQGWLVLEGGAVSYGKTTAYLPVIDLLRMYFRIQDRDGYREIRERITGRLSSLDRTLELALPAFLGLLDVPVEDPQWEALDPPQKRQRTLEAIKQLLLGESRVRPLLLLLEDLYWIDSETQAVLDSLVESLPVSRILLLVNYRPEYEHGWGEKSYYREIRVAALPRQSAEEFLGALLGDDPSLQPLRRLLIERTEGNAFFLEESVRTLVEIKALAGARGAYHLVTEARAIQVPATVQALLAARIDRLPVGEKRLLQAASVIGKDVPLVLLQAILEGDDEYDLHRGLADLQAAEFLYETSPLPDVEYTFKHALTHDVAYGSLLQGRRQLLHATIIEAIEKLYPERLIEHVEGLAHHALRAQAWEKAWRYARQAGDKAASRSAFREAVGWLEQALGVLPSLPQDSDVLAQAIDLRFELRNLLFALGEHGRILAHLQEAERLGRALGDERRLGWGSTYMSNYFWREGAPEQAVAEGLHALEVAERHGDLELKVTANFRLGQGYHGWGRYEEAVVCLRSNVAVLVGDLQHALFGLVGLPSVFSRSFLVWSLAELGGFREGSARGREAVEIAETADLPYSLAMARFTAGYLYLRQGELDRAVALLEPGLALCRAVEMPALLTQLLATLGYARVLQGRFAEGQALLEESVEPTTFYRSAPFSFPLLFLGEAAFLARRDPEAAQTAQRALDHARRRCERGWEAWALRLLGEIAARRDPPEIESAEEHLSKALALATELGMRPLLAHCHLGLGRLHRRTPGQRDHVQMHLATAAALYREMDMRSGLERAEEEVGRVSHLDFDERSP
jgi:class 3 adenylate cyclase/tetratricopeptide (TPR) repeat protein